MACSRCAQSACSCSLTAGTGVTVTGSGSTSNPWVVSAAAVTETSLTVVDSATVDLTASGAANHTLTAAVKVSPAAGQILTTDANGILVTCESVQDCVAPMMTANGFVYDDANGQWDATGTSGQLLTANGAGGASWTSPGGAYVTQNISRVAGAGGVVAGASPITYGSGATLALTAGEGTSITTAAGPSVTLAVRTSAASMAAAGFACAEANGAPIFITATGLRTLPPHTSQALLRLAANSPIQSILPNQGLITQASISRVITNPSPCRSASVHINAAQGWRTTTTGGVATGAVEGGGSQTFGGGALTAFAIAVWNPFYAAGNNAGNGATFATSAFRASTTDSFVLAPSGSFSYVTNSDLINRGTATITGLAGVEQAGILVTQ